MTIAILFASMINPCGSEPGIFFEEICPPWLLMPWLLTLPGHQQAWHLSHSINRPLSSIRKDFNNLRWDMLENATTFCVSQNTPARKELINMRRQTGGVSFLRHFAVITMTMDHCCVCGMFTFTAQTTDTVASPSIIYQCIVGEGIWWEDSGAMWAVYWRTR